VAGTVAVVGGGAGSPVQAATSAALLSATAVDSRCRRRSDLIVGLAAEAT
jgi:hypothetical protein